MNERYVAELLGASSPMHGALVAQKNFNRGLPIAGNDEVDPAWVVVDEGARPRREVAYGTRANMLLMATALNSTLQRS